MEIRRARPSDIEGIAAMEPMCFTDPWSREMVEREFSGLNPAEYYIAEEGGDMLGYCGIWTVLSESEIVNFAVRPDMRRRGIASALMEHVLAEAQERGVAQIALEVRVSNTAAIGLYQGFGFSKAGLRRGYYRDGEDAYIMLKLLGRENR